jgi:hypothetical protein
LTSVHENRSSRIAHTSFQYTPVASITSWVTPCASSHLGERQQAGDGGRERLHVLGALAV